MLFDTVTTFGAMEQWPNIDLQIGILILERWVHPWKQTCFSGVVLYELLSLELPFKGENLQDGCVQISSQMVCRETPFSSGIKICIRREVQPNNCKRESYLNKSISNKHSWNDQFYEPGTNHFILATGHSLTTMSTPSFCYVHFPSTSHFSSSLEQFGYVPSKLWIGWFQQIRRTIRYSCCNPSVFRHFLFKKEAKSEDMTHISKSTFCLQQLRYSSDLLSFTIVSEDGSSTLENYYHTGPKHWFDVFL